MSLAPLPPAPSRPRVLLIDPDPHGAALLQEILRPLEIDFEAALTGRAGLQAALCRPPSLIVSEIALPDLDGIDLCTHVKGLPALHDVPVLFMTSMEDPTAQAEALDAGCAGLLLKPLRTVLVRAAVRNALALKAALDANRVLVEQRRSLAAMLVHDMRNLIQANQGFAKLALLENVPPEVAESLRLMEQTAAELRIMANGLLELEHLETAVLPVRLRRVPLGELARRRAAVAGRNTRQIAVVLRDAADAHPVVRADPKLLSRILDNLIFNAVKFSPEEGEVFLSFGRTAQGWETRIENDGPPIPAEYHEKIFEKFGQLEPEERGERRGIGLGLAFCRMALREMRGSIRVDSPLPGRPGGARFSFILPAEEGAGN